MKYFLLIAFGVFLTACSGGYDNTIDSITSSPFYETCLSKAIESGNEFLASKGYLVQPNGSFTNSQGEYPTGKIESEMESLITKTLFDCLEKEEYKSSCNCSGDRYNCSDFSTHREAQDYFDCCMEKTGRDVSKLDRDKDYSVCETLP